MNGLKLITLFLSVSALVVILTGLAAAEGLTVVRDYRQQEADGSITYVAQLSDGTYKIIVRDYNEELPDGRIRHVGQTSDGGYLVLSVSGSERTVAREYWEELPDRTYRYVRQWSDGTYEVVFAQVPAPAPAPEPPSVLRDVWEKHGDGLFYHYRYWTDGRQELLDSPVRGAVQRHSSEGPYGVKVNINPGYALVGCQYYPVRAGELIRVVSGRDGHTVAISGHPDYGSGCVVYEPVVGGDYIIFFPLDNSVHPGYFWFDIVEAR